MTVLFLKINFYWKGSIFTFFSLFKLKYTFMPNITLLFKSVFVIFLLSLVACKSDKVDDKPKAKPDPQLDALNEIVEKNPNNADALFNRAQYYYDIEGYDEAILDLSSAMKIDSLKPKYYHLLADTYMDYYQSRMALLTMQKASGMFPDSIRTLLKLTEYEMILKQYDEAMQTIKIILEKDKQNADAYLLMGSVLNESGDSKRALLAFKKATEIDPYLIDGWIKAGALSDEIKEKDAEKYFKTALKIDSTSYQALYAMAMHHQNLNHLDEAITWYKKMNLVFPKTAQPYFNIGVLYQEMDSLDKSLEFLTIATELDKIYAEAYYAKGIVLEKQGKLAEAQKQYSQASTISPKFVKAEQASQRLKNLLKEKAVK